LGSSAAGGYLDSVPPRQDRSWSLYGPRFSAAVRPWSSCRPPRGLGARLSGRAMAEALDEPLGVVPRNERRDDRARLLEGLEVMEVHALFFERAHEAFGHAVALGLPDVGRRDRDARPLHLVDPGIGDVLGAPVTPHLQPPGDVLAESAEGVADALADRFQGGPAIAPLHDMPAEQFVSVVVDRSKEPAPAFALRVET